MEIVIPGTPGASYMSCQLTCPKDLDDENDYAFPSYPKHSFGSHSPSSSPTSSHAPLPTHRQQASSSSDFSFGRHAVPMAQTPSYSGRPALPKSSVSYAGTSPHHGYDYGAKDVKPPKQLGKFSNGSSSSLINGGTSISSSTGGGFLASRKGSLASIKNAFKSTASVPVPPVPPLDRSQSAAPGYPALRNPFSRFDSSPASPSSSRPSFSAVRAGKLPSLSSPGPSAFNDRKYSVATTHSSNRSQGGRSTTSNGSSNIRMGDDHPLPAIPKIPARSGPSRNGGMGGHSGSFSGVDGYGSRRNGSSGGDYDWATSAKTPSEEALRVVFRNFAEAANAKIARIYARPLVRPWSSFSLLKLSLPKYDLLN